MTEQKGYSGPGYVSLSDTDSFIEWNIPIFESHSSYGIQFRYQSSESQPNLDLFIDGYWRKSIDLPSTGPNTWVDTEAFLVPLSYGNHSIRLKTRHVQSVGGQNIVSEIKVEVICQNPTYDLNAQLCESFPNFFCYLLQRIS